MYFEVHVIKLMEIFGDHFYDSAKFPQPVIGKVSVAQFLASICDCSLFFVLFCVWAWIGSCYDRRSLSMNPRTENILVSFASHHCSQFDTVDQGHPAIHILCQRRNLFAISCSSSPHHPDFSYQYQYPLESGLFSPSSDWQCSQLLAPEMTDADKAFRIL